MQQAKMDLQHASVAVIGAGTMGIGIAQLAAMHGHKTYVFDVDVARTEQALAQLEKQLAARVEKGKMTQQLLDDTLANLHVAQQLQDLAAVQLVVEAIVEKKEVKQSVFQQLADICSADTIFASNTSSISITAIAATIPHPERVIGLHFFNPAPVMKLVEIIRGLKSSQQICDALFALMKTWKKVAVTAKSTPGFIVNRVARPYYAEGFRALQENVTTPEQLDFLLRECGRFAMGPCELTDLIGQDVNFSVTQSVYQEFFYEPRYRPSLVQKELVDGGCFGRKSGQGFYHYDGKVQSPVFMPEQQKTQPISTVEVYGTWASMPDLIARLQQQTQVTVVLHASDESYIQIKDVTLRLPQGESVDLSHLNDKVVVMDWHADWENAKAIAVTASQACDVEALEQVNALFFAINVIPVWIKDHPAMLTMRSIATLINEACEAVLHGIASEQDIDSAMKYGVNYPQGPFQWAEKIGYNTILQILEKMYHIYSEEKYRPSLYLRKKAAQVNVQSSETTLYRQAV